MIFPIQYIINCDISSMIFLTCVWLGENFFLTSVWMELRNAGVNYKLYFYEKRVFFVDVLMA